jgi:hypothetical protein
MKEGFKSFPVGFLIKNKNACEEGKKCKGKDYSAEKAGFHLFWFVRLFY